MLPFCLEGNCIERECFAENDLVDTLIQAGPHIEARVTACWLWLVSVLTSHE